MATCSNDNRVKIWKIENSNYTNWTLLTTYSGHTSDVKALEYLDEDTVASGSIDNTIKTWSINTSITIASTTGISDIRSLRLLSNGIHLACGYSNGIINIFIIKTMSLVATLTGHNSYVNELLLINSSLLASSSNDNNIRIWNLTSYASKFVLSGHTSYVYALRLVSVDILASGSLDNTIKLWNTRTGSLVNTLIGHSNGIYLSIDMLNEADQTLISGSSDQTIKTWNANTGLCLKTIDTGLDIVALAVLSSTKLEGKTLFFFSSFSTYGRKGMTQEKINAYFNEFKRGCVFNGMKRVLLHFIKMPMDLMICPGHNIEGL